MMGCTFYMRLSDTLIPDSIYLFKNNEDPVWSYLNCNASNDTFDFFSSMISPVLNGLRTLPMVCANKGCKLASFGGEPNNPLIDVFCFFNERIGVSISLVNYFFKVVFLFVKDPSIVPLLGGLGVLIGDKPVSEFLLAAIYLCIKLA